MLVIPRVPVLVVVPAGAVRVAVAVRVGVRVAVSVRVAVLVTVVVVVVVVVIVVVVVVAVRHVAAHPLGSMRCTAMAAPNPLSMFTTVTPAAQEVSIEKSAVNPPSAAP